MHCHLLIPQLFPPGARTPGNDPLHGARAPALQTLLARASYQPNPFPDAESWLCEQFGVTADAWGNYPRSALSMKGEAIEPGLSAWLHASPVNLVAERDQLLLNAPIQLNIQAQERDALIATLNRHFESEGLFFIAAGMYRWHVRLPSLPQAFTYPLPTVSGESIRHYLPTGPDSPMLLSLMNESQMLLHDHAVNQARESNDLPPVNGLCLCGGGLMPSALLRAFDHLWSQNPLDLGLAKSSGTIDHPLPSNAIDWLAQAHPGKHLLSLDHLQTCWLTRDPASWRAVLAQLEREWFAPLKRALARGKLRLTLHLPGTGSFYLSRAHLLRFWQPRRKLVYYRNGRSTHDPEKG